MVKKKQKESQDYFGLISLLIFVTIFGRVKKAWSYERGSQKSLFEGQLQWPSEIGERDK